MPESLTRKSSRASPISDADFAAVQLAGERLRAEIVTLLDNVPPGVRRTRALARHLDLDRNTCHRVISAIRQLTDPGVEVIAKLPGIAGLRLFVDALERVGARRQDVRSARAAVDRMASLVDQFGGSFSSLQRRCAATISADQDRVGGLHGSPEVPGSRQALHLAAAELVGRRLDAQVTTAFIRPLPSSPSLIEHVGVNALLGHQQLRDDAMPLAMTYAFLDTNSASVNPDPEYREWLKPSTGQQLLPEFCSRPPPVVTPRKGGLGQFQLVIDVADPFSKSDIVLASRIEPLPHVLNQEVPVWNTVVRVRIPTAVLVLEVHLHRSLALSSVPSIGAYTWHPSLADNLSKYWHERVPIDARIELLGPSHRVSSTPYWKRHAEMVDRVYGQLGWAAEEFVTYRVTQQFPPWGVFYYFSSDFSQAGPAV